MTATTTLTAQVDAALRGSRFAASTTRMFSDGSIGVDWSWANEERAALVEYLRAAGFTATDRVHTVLVRKAA